MLLYIIFHLPKKKSMLSMPYLSMPYLSGKVEVGREWQEFEGGEVKCIRRKMVQARNFNN